VTPPKRTRPCRIATAPTSVRAFRVVFLRSGRNHGSSGLGATDLLIRANAGEELSEADRLAFQALIASRTNQAFLHYRRSLLLGALETVPVLGCARFLVRNPAAYRQWNLDQQDYQRATAAVGLPVDRAWADSVQQMVEKLRQAESEKEP